MGKDLIPSEINETPDAIRATVAETRPGAKQVAAAIRQTRPRRIFLVGNGSSFYSSLAATYTARALAKPEDPMVTALPAGDFRYFMPQLDGRDVIVGVSSSGEFRDVLSVFKRQRGQQLLIGVTHVPDSSITRLADHTLVSRGGESRVPVMTKTYASTLTAIHLLFLELFNARVSYFSDLLDAAERCADAVAEAQKTLEELVPLINRFDHAFVFGAGNAYPASLECALKMKEIALLHAEGSESWEMASGPATMINAQTMCVALSSGGSGDEATALGAQHARQWGARVLEVGPASEAGDLHLEVPAPRYEAFASLALTAPISLIAYHVARLRGYTPDTPDWRERYYEQGMTHIFGD